MKTLWGGGAHKAPPPPIITKVKGNQDRRTYKSLLKSVYKKHIFQVLELCIIDVTLETMVIMVIVVKSIINLI